MKFLCDNCKAKYQIGDDKVAGKTVRMKCRRCGFDIHVNASTIVEETSAAPWPDASATMQGSMAIVTPELAASLGLRPPAAPVAPAAPGAPAAPRPLGAASIPKPAIPRAVPAPRPVVPAPAPAPAPQAAAPQTAWDPADGEPEDESTAIMTVPLRIAVAAAKAATSAGTPAPATPSPPIATPTPTAATPAARPLAATPRPAPAATPRPAVAAATPRPAVAAAPRAAAPAPRPPAAEPAAASPTTPKPAPGGVAGAFARAAIAPEPAAPAIAPDGWYVGISGTPFGPASLDAIREKCRSGEIHADSLVWRDGQGEWKPLRTFPALFAMFNDVNGVDDPPTTDNVVNPGNAVNAARVASLASNVPAATPTPAPYTAPAAPEPEPPPPSEPPYAVSAFSSPNGRGSAATAVLTDVFPDRAGNPFAALGLQQSGGAAPDAAPDLGILADPFAAPAPAPAPTTPPPGPAPLSPKAPSSPDGAGGFASGTGGAPVDIDESVVPRRRNPPHPLAYAFIAFAAVFGGVAAYVLLAKPQQIVVVQTTPSATVAAVQPSIDKPQASVEAVVGEPTTDSSGAAVVRPGVPGTGGPRPKASSTANAAPIDTSGFTSTIPGPSTAQVPPPPVSGSQLSAGEIQGVVAQNQSIVKRKCWQPALESRAANAPTNARVNGAITIGASGNVESASASGGERDFPGLSSCIASRMKNWKFPPSSGSTPVNVPFVFAGQ
jgi:predicted Zn finger-like uncharacterized protein